MPDGTLDKGGALGQDAFLKLLMAQMQHQDPSAPTDSAQMMTQLAQFSSVESLTGLNRKLAGIGAGQDFSTAVGLIGRTVDYTDADGRARTGVVDGVEQDRDGVLLRVGAERVATDRVVRVRPSAT
jgi:flagellar basal-body rod modification protein FlgD